MSTVTDEYVMPEIEVDDWVVWKQSPGMPQQCPALVTRVGENALNLVVLYEDQETGRNSFEHKSGVRHATDPFLHDTRLNEFYINESLGVWVESKGLLAKRQMQKDLDQIKRDFKTLEAKLLKELAAALKK